MARKKATTKKKVVPKIVTEGAASVVTVAGEADKKAAKAQAKVLPEFDTAEALDHNAQLAGISRAPGLNKDPEPEPEPDPEPAPEPEPEPEPEPVEPDPEPEPEEEEGDLGDEGTA